MKPTRLLNQIAALAFAFTATGCGITPMYTNIGSNGAYGDANRLVAPQAIPTLPKGVTARGLTMTPGTAATRVGESFRFTIAIKGSDNKVYSDPRLCTWTLSNLQLGTVDINGVLVPAQAGTVKVIAQIAGISAESTVTIDPARYAWQQVMSPVTANLKAVKMISRVEAWGAGEKGTMLRFINGGWYVEPTFRNPDATINGLGFANNSMGWAVGSRAGGASPFVSKWNGQTWTNFSLPVSAGSLKAVSVVNDRDAWACGEDEDGDALLLHFDGTAWRNVEAPGGGRLNDIQMLSSRAGWAVGKGGGLVSTPLILKYENGSWSKKNFWDNRGTVKVTDSQELTAIKMISDTQGYAVGIRDNLLINPRGLFLSYDPKRDGWVPGAYDQSVEGLDQVPLHDIEMISGTEGWALGEVRTPDYTFTRNPKSIFGNLLANSNGVLKVDTNYFSGNLNGAFAAIDLMPTGEGFVVGEGGYILQRTYDWRGTNSGSTYGNTSGTGMSGSVGTTYGPGGAAIPGGTPTSSNTYY